MQSIIRQRKDRRLWLQGSHAHASGVLRFFPVALKKNYIAAGWDLSDATPINDEIAAEFMKNPPTGKIRGVSSDGMPVWLDVESEPASPKLLRYRRSRPDGFCCVDPHQRDPIFLPVSQGGGFFFRRDLCINSILSPLDFRISISA